MDERLNATIKLEDANNQNNNSMFEEYQASDDRITLYALNSQKPMENMPYIFCPKCNKKVIADSRFCNFCGYQVNK